MQRRMQSRYELLALLVVYAVKVLWDCEVRHNLAAALSWLIQLIGRGFIVGYQYPGSVKHRSAYAISIALGREDALND